MEGMVSIDFSIDELGIIRAFFYHHIKEEVRKYADSDDGLDYIATLLDVYRTFGKEIEED